VVPESYEDVVIPSSQPIEGSVTSRWPRWWSADGDIRY